jgi:hypothetical protein
MANTIKIDPRKLPIPWSTSTNYRVAMTQGLVAQTGGVRFLSPNVDNVSTVTTFAEGPSVVSVFPTYGTTSTFTSTIQINYNRPVVATTGTGNYYLYKADGTLVHTIESTSTRLTRSSKTAKINFVGYFEPLTTYYVTADPGMYRDLFRFPSPAIVDDSKIKFTIGDGPTVINKTPVYGIQNTFVSSSTITFSKTISVNTGNFYLNKVGGSVRTIPVTSSSVSIIGTNTVKILFYDQPTPEGDYFLTFDYYILKDQNDLPVYAVSDDSLIKFSEKTIKDMSVRQYRAFTSTFIFTASTVVSNLTSVTTFVPKVLDFAPDPNKQYELRLTSPIGSFSHATTGTNSGSVWTYVGTNTSINNIFADIKFTPSIVSNSNSYYNYKLIRDDVTLVDNNFDLYGFAYPLTTTPPVDPYNPIYATVPKSLLSLSVADILATNPVVNEPVTLTARLTSYVTLGGTVQFKENNVVIATATMSGAGVATTTTTFSTTGYRFISASWLGGQMSNGNVYEPLDTPDTWVNVQSARELNAGFTISSSEADGTSFTNLYPITFTATISTSTSLTGANAGIVTLKRATFTSQNKNDRIVYTSNIINSLSEVGNDYRLVMSDNSPGLLSVGDWIEVTGTLTSVGTVKSNYQVTGIDGRYINVSKNRSENDNLYYPYDPLKIRMTASSTITLNSLAKRSLANDGVQSIITSVVAISTATLVNNKATFSNLTLPIDTPGQYYFIADWEGTSIAPKYYSKRTSNFITQNIVPRSSYNIGITATPNPFFVRNETGTGTNLLVTATISLSNYSYTAKRPTGVVSLYDGVRLLGTGTLSRLSLQDVVATTITWSPANFNQIDTGTKVLSAVYDGDIFNLPMTAVTATSTQTSLISFSAFTKRNGTNIVGGGGNTNGSGPAGYGLRVSPTTSTGNAFSTDVDSNGLPIAYRPETITFNATVSNVAFSGKSVSWYQNGLSLGTSNFIGTTATIQINTNIQSTGTYSIYASFAEDYNFLGMTSNTYRYRMDKRSPTVTVTPAASVIYRPNVQTETASYRYKGTTLDRTGSTFRLTRDSTTSTDQIIAGASTVYTIDPKTISIGEHQFKAELIGDNSYYNGNYTYTVGIAKGTQILSASLNPSENLNEYTSSPATLTISAGDQRPSGTATVTIISSSIVGTSVSKVTNELQAGGQYNQNLPREDDMVLIEVRVPTKFIQGISTSTLVKTANTSGSIGTWWTYPDVGDKLQFWADGNGPVSLDWYFSQYWGYNWTTTENIPLPNTNVYYSRAPYSFQNDLYNGPTRSTYWKLIPRFTESGGTVTVCYAQLWGRTNATGQVVNAILPGYPNGYSGSITLPDWPVTYSMTNGKTTDKAGVWGRSLGTYLGSNGGYYDIVNYQVVFVRYDNGQIVQTPMREASSWFSSHLNGITPVETQGGTWAAWYPSAWYYSPPYNVGRQYINSRVHTIVPPILANYRTKPQINLRVEGETSGYTAGQVLTVGSISTATGTVNFGPYNIPKGGHTFRVTVAEDFNYNTGTVDLTVIKYIK